jgi:hypothetical protein
MFQNLLWHSRADQLTNHVRAVVLIVRLALGTFHARLHLSAHTNTVSWLDALHLRSNSQNLPDDLVANANWCHSQISPTSSNCVDIGTANSAAFTLDIDVVVLEDLGREL